MKNKSIIGEDFSFVEGLLTDYNGSSTIERKVLGTSKLGSTKNLSFHILVIDALDIFQAITLPTFSSTINFSTHHVSQAGLQVQKVCIKHWLISDQSAISCLGNPQILLITRF